MKSLFQLCVDFCFKKNSFIGTLHTLHPSHGTHTQGIYSLWSYKDTHVRAMIRFMKTYRSVLLSKEISVHAYSYINDYLGDQQMLGYFKHPIIIPIPMDRQRLHERGFNQNHLWGKYLAHHTHGTYAQHILQKITPTKKQALISKRSERFSNIKNSFGISKKHYSCISQKDIILIDDLTTTGATLLEAKKVLEQAGARTILMLTLAH
jgi:ComF family protein